MKFIGFMLAVPVFVALIVIEIAKTAYQAIAYCSEILYDGIRHRDWYL